MNIERILLKNYGITLDRGGDLKSLYLDISAMRGSVMHGLQDLVFRLVKILYGKRWKSFFFVDLKISSIIIQYFFHFSALDSHVVKS